MHERRGLKGRAQGDTRLVMVHPALIAMLHTVIDQYDLQPGDLLFPGEGGGMLAGSGFRRVWSKARKAVLPEHEYSSPVGKRVHDLRRVGSSLGRADRSWVPPAGLEPAAKRLEGACSIARSYPLSCANTSLAILGLPPWDVCGTSDAILHPAFPNARSKARLTSARAERTTRSRSTAR